MRKRIIVLLVLLLTVIVGYNYIYQDHRDIKNEVAEYSISSNEIALMFFENATRSEQKLLNKTIEVSGAISEINVGEVTIDDKIFCQLSNKTLTLTKGDEHIKIKGRVIGYDDLLEQVKLDQCIILNQ
ncbi:hypothetical protein [uncultured Psychroserpens sp.]|uniref:OB-fold protein n=1 Tax=uncultured Psychroserpens sp. TaxID=255436 RepID=UPI00262A8731|nr:hypothetical protein [uncultured Psychroserpens sp.]